jgi:tetratricopeptide (TPR) repeat protein
MTNARGTASWLARPALAVTFALATGCGTSTLVTAPASGAPMDSSCPAGTTWDGARCAARALPVAIDPPDGDVAESTDHPILAPALDPALFRDGRRAPRALALLVVETQQLEALERATGRAAPDRPVLLRRIAEDYVEIEKAAMAERVVPGDPARQDVRRRTAERAQQEALRRYGTLVAEYGGQPSPAFPSPPPADPRVDEARYFLAYERERAGDLAGARRGYFELIAKSPASRYVPQAYLAFGELFFWEAAGDPSKWELARLAFTKVLATPPPGNTVYAYAWYRLAYVLVNQGDREGALHAFDKAVDAATAFPQLPGSNALAEEARGQRAALSPDAPTPPALTAPP